MFTGYSRYRLHVNFNIHLLLLIPTVGETLESLIYMYRIPPQTIGKVVRETCQAIIDVLC